MKIVKVKYIFKLILLSKDYVALALQDSKKL